MCERNAGRSHMAGGSQGVHDLNMPNRGIVLRAQAPKEWHWYTSAG